MYPGKSYSQSSYNSNCEYRSNHWNDQEPNNTIGNKANQSKPKGAWNSIGLCQSPPYNFRCKGGDKFKNSS